MKKLVLATAALLASTTLGFAQPTTAPATMPSTRPLAGKPLVQVCFVLDTTGSMSGLLEGAKAKIWSIANSIVRTEPRPHVQIALVGYRDRGDEYITKVFDLTDDIDTVFKNLSDFRAGGGGDTPESVNQAMFEAVTKINWSKDRAVSKIVFLVGDAPPHMNYADDVKYPDICQQAVKKDLIINTIQCGAIAATTPIWQEISRLSEGGYVALGQTGNMVVTSTPFDKDLSELNGKMNLTVVAYGSRAQQQVTNDKVAFGGGRGGGGGGFGGIGAAGGRARGGAGGPSTAPAAAEAAAADRAIYNLATVKAVQGAGDLIDDLRDGRVKLESLKTEELPPELAKLTPEEQKAYLDKQRTERDQLRTQISDLAKKRQDYLDAERKRLAESGGEKDAFDTKVAEMIKEQAARKHATE